jgi:hypothetical protein
VVVAGAELTGAEVVERARADAPALGLTGPGARLLSGLSYDTWEGLSAGLFAPLAVGGSVVLCRNLSQVGEDAVAKRIESERVTATAPLTGPPGWLGRRFFAPAAPTLPHSRLRSSGGTPIVPFRGSAPEPPYRRPERDLVALPSAPGPGRGEPRPATVPHVIPHSAHPPKPPAPPGPWS